MSRSMLWLGAALVMVTAAAAAPHAFNAQDLVTMDRVSDPQVSPDGKWVAFVVRTTDMEASKGRTDLWLVDAAGRDEPRRLTTHDANDSAPRWSADGESLFFLSTRSGSQQVWRLPLEGGEAEAVTALPLDVTNLLVSPDGRHLAITLDVFPDADVATTAERLQAAESSKVSGRVYDRIFVRHWDTWSDGRRSHLFVVPVGGGTAVDLMPGMDADTPSKPFGGGEEIAFTPDGSGLVFAARDVGASEPWSTNLDLFYVAADGGAAPRRLTTSEATDTQPVFSPDGKTLAYLAMRRPGYEADRYRILLRDGLDGSERVLAEDWDRSANGILFSSDGRTIFTTAGDVGQVALFAVDVASGKVTKLATDGSIASPALAGERVVFARDDLGSPADLYSVAAAGGEVERLTDVNRERLADIRFGDYEQFSFAGWNDETVYGWVVKPADFEAGKKYPVAFLIHGGPQGSFDNHFHYRWNPQTYAGAGYGVVTVDFHGSTGYGQAFTDSINGDWGGKPLEDLQKGLAAALERYPWLDGDRACALGASYGGFMINWIAGTWPDRFRCLVNHDGTFDQRAMYYETEELWFPEWEFGGTPWERPELFEKWSPSRFAGNWKTPMLVVHGALDFRLPETQGLATFNALQRRGIPSRLLYFPDENHWVLKPHNSLKWHEEVLAWLDRWTR